MLFARGALALRDARLRWAVVMSSRLWLMATSRTGLTMDIRFVPPARGAPKRNACLYHLVRGTWTAFSPSVARFEGPTAFLVTREQLDGANGGRSLSYRSVGAPYHAIELHGPAADFGEVGATPAPVALDAETWRLARRVIDIGFDADEALAASVTDLVGRLTELGLVTREARDRLTKPTSAIMRGVWRAVRPMMDGFAPSANLKDVSSASGLSERQVARNVGWILNRFAFPSDGWRLAMHTLRLKLAVLLLSAEGATVGEVADALGYKSITAMAKAFREAKLATPSEIQRLVRDASP